MVYGFALVAIMAAGCMSGFVGSDILGRMVEGDPKLESRRMMLDYTFRLNQAYSSVYVVGSCMAIFLWSLEMVRTRLLSRGLGVYGLVLGPVIVAALFSGQLPLDVHGFGFVVLVQSVWFVIAGTRVDEVRGGWNASTNHDLIICFLRPARWIVVCFSSWPISSSLHPLEASAA